MQTLNFTNYFTQNFSDPLQNVVVFKDIVTPNVCKEVANYSYELFKVGKMSKNASGENRWRHRLININFEPITNIVNNFNEIFAKYNGVPDDKIGNIITYNIADSFIQPHTDDYGPCHLRVNLIMEKAEFSGNPIIQGMLYKMLPGDGWAFSPSHTVHGTSMLTTGRRINLSMGWNFNNLQDYTNAFISISSK